jgi:6-phosphogluconolactonase
MTKANSENFFETREEASVAAAQDIAKCLSGRLNVQARASIVVTGGSSPARCYEELSELSLDWKRTHVVLSDELWVPSDHDDSNERLVRHTLLQREATPAMLLPVFHSTKTIEARCDEIDKEIRALPFPFACTLLGMGEDGHIASLFPDAGNLAEGLDVDNEQLCIPVETAASPHPRVSLTLAAIARSDAVVLLMFGDSKREIYDQARERGSNLPVAALLKQKKAPVHVYWAP